MAMRMGDYTVTEAGFGADLGAEKFLDIKCRMAGLAPDAVVVVGTVRALKMHGGLDKKQLSQENLSALEKGIPNLLRHVNNITKVYHLPCVVAINRFPTDTDEEITRIAHATPTELICTKGEKAFREIEAQVIRDVVAPLSGVIVATGGGAILRDDNVRRLKRNGRVIFLDRSIDSLEATKDRPLSGDREALCRRYEERYPRYCSVADVCLPVPDGELPETTADRVLKNV
jgi:shikimate kinase